MQLESAGIENAAIDFLRADLLVWQRASHAEDGSSNWQFRSLLMSSTDREEGFRDRSNVPEQAYRAPFEPSIKPITTVQQRRLGHYSR